MAERLGANFSIDITQLQAGLKTANKLIRESQSEFGNAAAGMDDWTKSEEGLNAKLKSLSSIMEVQKEKVRALKENYNKLIADGMDPMSNRAIDLRTQINNEEKAFQKCAIEISQNSDALDKLKNSTDEAGEASAKASGNLSKLGEIAKTAGAAVAASFAAIGAAAIAAGKKIWDMANETAKAGDEIDKESQKLGISAENYQKLSYAMEMSGASIEDFKKGTMNISKELANVQNGVEGAGKSFEKLGVSLVNSDGSIKRTEDVLLDSIDALAKMEDITQRDAYASEIFGKSYRELAPLLNSGAEGIKDLMQEAEDYGMVMSNEAVAASASFDDSLTRLRGAIEGVKNDLLGSLLPPLSMLIDGFSELVSGVGDGSQKIKDAVSSLINKITKDAPKVIKLIKTIAQSLLTAIPDIFTSLTNEIMLLLPDLVSTIMDVVPMLITSLLEMLPTLTQTVISVIVQLLNAITSMTPTVIDSIMQILPALILALIDSIPELLQAAIQLLMAIVDAIPVIIDSLLTSLPEIIDTIVNTLIDNMPLVLQGALKLLMGIIKAIPDIQKSLITNLPLIIRSIVSGLIKGIPEMIKTGGELLAGLFEGLLNPKAIWEACKNLFNSVLDGLKNLFGIASPSKVMENIIGKNLALGIGEGFENNIGKVNDAIAESMDFEKNAAININRQGGTTGENGGKSITINQYNTYSQAHSRYELYKSKQETAAAVRLAVEAV